MKPWNKYRVGKPAAKGFNDDCVELTRVDHVAHVKAAVRIAEDRLLRAGLIFDESKLNRQRILVNWFSPNDWAYGFRYGNIRFRHDFRTLVEGKRAYWVESMAYGIEACRILITDVDRSARLDSYDPTVGDGPWWHDTSSGTHYWNGTYTLEFMIERDITLGEFERVDFVSHHARMCSNNWAACPDLDRDKDRGGALFLARVVADGIDTSAFKMTDAGKGGAIEPGWALRGGVGPIMIKVSRIKCKGAVGRTDPAAPALARAILHAYAASQSDLGPLVETFASDDDACGAVADLIGSAFGLTKVDSLLY